MNKNKYHMNNNSKKTEEPERMVSPLAQAVRYISIVCFILCLVEMLCYIGGTGRSEELDSTGYMDATEELTSMSKLQWIAADSEGNVYCYYAHNKELAVYDADLNLQFVYALPYIRSGKLTFGQDGDAIYAYCTRTEAVYIYEDGAFVRRVESDEAEYEDLVQLVADHPCNATSVTSASGDTYRINRIYPTISKNGKAVIHVAFTYWIHMAPAPAWQIALILMVVAGLLTLLYYHLAPEEEKK